MIPVLVLDNHIIDPILRRLHRADRILRRLSENLGDAESRSGGSSGSSRHVVVITLVYVIKVENQILKEYAHAILQNILLTLVRL